MGWIARVLSSTRRTRRGVPTTDVKSNPGGGANETAAQFQPAGDDARPLADDYAYTGALPRQGGAAHVGYQDASNAGKANPGEKRLYARDSGGAVVAEIYLQNDGSLTLENGAGSVSVAANGSISADSGGASAALNNDKTLSITDGTGMISMDGAGTVDINGVTIDPSGNITGPAAMTLTGTITAADLIAGPLTFTTHKQSGVTPGSGTSGGPVP